MAHADRVLNVFIYLFFVFGCPQIHIFGDLHGGDGHQDHIQGIHIEQVHVLEEPVELAGLHCDHVGLRDHWHGCRQSGRAAYVPRSSGPEDRVYNAR